MNEFDQFERSLAAALRSDADQSLARFEPATVARAAMAGTKRRSLRLPWETVGPASNRWAVAAAAIVGVLLVGGAILMIQRGQPAVVVGPSLTPSAAPSQPAVAAPSAGPTAMPSPTPTPIVWTQASLDEDWPAPVRTEPAGPAIVLPILHKTVVEGTNCPGDCGYTSTFGEHVDPTGDTGSAVFPWVDIRGVRFCGTSCLTPDLVTHDRPVVDPVEQWMAYGVVFDTDRDGVGDWRYGVDNLPLDPSGWAANPDSERMARDELANGAAPHRAWRTDLHTGRTESAAGPPYGGVGETRFDTFWTRWSFGGDSPGGHVGMTFDVPFYVWASEIKDGRIVATDFAPDVGWLLPSPDAKP